MPRPLTGWIARAVHLTSAADRAYRLFDRTRSTLVLAFASDEFLDEYNRIAYGRSESYRAGAATFRAGLFDWEREAIDRYFPPPPGRVLVGGAGGGREAFALVERGYTVVAFDPADALVDSMRATAPAGLRACRGGYGDLPHLEDVEGRTVDLATGAPFDAAIVGWSSFSHLRSDGERLDALRRLGALTRGPILVSYFAQGGDGRPGTSGGSIGRWIRRRRDARGPSVFSVRIGYYRLLTHDDMESFVRNAGLDVAGADRDGNWPYVVATAGAAR